MVHDKRSSEGRTERIAVLQKSGLNISEDRSVKERTRLGVAHVSHDDLLDALACLITASHIRDGRSQLLVDQRDATGLLMEIVTCTI